MNEDIIVRLLQMYQSENTSGWKLAGEARDEILATRAAIATAQAERSEALAECNCAVLERDAALQRAEQAEAALAQAQAERDSLIKRLDFWIECNNSERANGRMPTFLNPYTILLWIGDKRVAAEADAAQPPALPPLPNGWEPYDEGAHTHATFKRGSDMVEAIPGSLEVVVDALATPADLITVLRHAEAAHQQLKEGHRG